MHIVQVAESLEVGGAERVVVELSNALAARHRVTVVCMQRAGDLAAQLASNIQVHCLNKPPGGGFDGARKLTQLLRTARADAIHSHHWGIFLDCVASGMAARVPVMVHTAHGLYMSRTNGALSAAKRAARHWLERRSMAYCDRVVCVSEQLVDHVVDEVGVSRRKIEVVPNGVRTTPSTSNALARDRHDGKFVCVAVGRLSPVKNFSLLIEAVARARAECPQLELQFAGDGPERERLSEAARSHGIAGHVQFLGMRSDVDAVLRDADLFALSSVSEGMPMAVLEAMRSRLPVLATRVGGLPTLVSEGVTGVLVPSGDAAAMAVELARFARSPETARRMGEAGFDRLQRDYSIEAMVLSYERLFDARS